MAMNIDQLIKIMVIGIIATLILTSIVGVILVVHNFLPEDEEIIPFVTDIGQDSLSNAAGYLNDLASPGQNTDCSKTVASDNNSGADDSAVLIPHFIPDDPWYSPTDFNNSAPPEQPPEEDVLQTLYENKFAMLYTPVSLRATVEKGPLLIKYAVIKDSEDLTPYHSFLEIIISDYETGEIFVKDGYGREYSSEEEHSIKILRTGDFRIDLYGSGLLLDLKVMSGISADLIPDTKPAEENAVPEFPRQTGW